MNFRHKTGKGKKHEENPLTAETVIIVDILLHVKKASGEDTDTKQPCPPGEVRYRVIYLLPHVACDNYNRL